jgi:hypothetical protein
MKISTFLDNNRVELSKIINGLADNFNSHEFIEKFASTFETEYIDFLNEYKRKGAFQKVHSQIGKFLKVNENYFKISGIDKKNSKNIFGNIDGVELWKKI